MPRIIVTLIVALAILAGCSPYVLPAGAAPAPATPAATADPCRPGDRPCWEAHIAKRQAEVRAWWAEVRAQQVRERGWNRLLAHLAAEAQRRAQQLGDCLLQGVVICNGRDLPTRYIVWRESRFQWWAKNPASSAGGLYGLLAGWMPKCGIRGYAHMGQVPIAEQARCARYVWNGGVNTYDHRWLGPVNWR